MRSNRKHLFFKVFFIFLIFVILNFNSVYGRIWHNGAGSGYGDGGDGENSKNITIENYVIEGAGYFIKANSHIQLLLQKIEMSDIKGIYYNELNLIVDSALNNIKKAKNTYKNLIETAEVTPYNKAVIFRLSVFRYRQFMSNNRLNKDVFKKVRYFLKRGDITGIFKKTLSDFKYLSILLRSINNEISINRLPDISNFRGLNEKINEITLFGSYVARVFNEIELK